MKNEYYFEDGGKHHRSDTKPHYFKPGSDKGEQIRSHPRGHHPRRQLG